MLVRLTSGQYTDRWSSLTVKTLLGSSASFEQIATETLLRHRMARRERPGFLRLYVGGELEASAPQHHMDVVGQPRGERFVGGIRMIAHARLSL